MRFSTSDARQSPAHPPTRTVLLVSKPVVPPWNDSSKNLVHDLALHGERFRYRVMTAAGQPLEGPRVTSEPVYAAAGRYTPGLLQNLRALRRLLRRDETALSHFFFAPNPRAALAARLALSLRPRLTVQTVCSLPASFERASELLFARRVVVLSRHARRAFVAAGVPEQRLSVIPPAIRLPPLPSPTDRAAARARSGLLLESLVVTYPGDYQFSSAAETFAGSIPRLAGLPVPVTFVFACRIKQPASLAIEQRIAGELAAAGVKDSVLMLREVPDMLDLLAATDICVLPAESLYAKMDLPLVLIEAMALGVPIVVASCPPVCELLERDGPGEGGGGVTVPPGDGPALAAALRALLESPARREALASEARQQAIARHDIGEMSRRYEDLYDEMLEPVPETAERLELWQEPPEP